MSRRRSIEQQSEKTLNRGIKILENYKEKVTLDREKRLESNSHKKTKINFKYLRAFFVVAVVVVVIFFVNYGPILGLKLIDIPKDPILIDNVLSNESLYMEYNNELLIYTGGKINTYDKSGNKTWEYDLDENFSPTIYTNGKYLVLINKTNGMLYYFKNKKEIANKIIDGNIENVYIANDGRFVVQYTKSSGYKKVIAMYDERAKLKFDEAYIDSTPIIGIEFLNDKNKLLIVQADSSLINIGTNFCILTYEKEITLDIINKFSDKLVYNYKLINDDIIYISNNAVESYNIKSKVEKVICSLQENQINFISLYNNYFTTLETVDEGYSFTSKRFDDTVISSVVLSTYPKYIEMSGLLTYVVSENCIDIINKWGVVVNKVDISLSPKSIVVFNDEKSAALVYSNKVQIIGL